MRLRLFCLSILIAMAAQAQVVVDQEPLVFDSPQQQQRFNSLTEELRCLVCQNQNLADSDAPLAHDLRNEIFNMMQAGQDDAQIKSFLIERYGDFVLYKPPMQGNTLFLWLAPGFLLLAGATVILMTIRKRKALLGGEDSGQQ